MNEPILKIIYFFTFGLIVFKQFVSESGSFIIYSSTVMSLLFILIIFMRFIKEKEAIIPISERRIILIISLYVVSTFLNGIFFDPSKITLVMLNNIPYIAFALLLLSFKNNENYVISIYDYVTYLFMFILISALILYVLGYSKISFSLPQIIELVPSEEYISEFGEGRLSWLMTHKSKFAIFCMMGVLFILNNKKLSVRTKFFFVSLGFLNIYFSNSLTVLFATFITIIPLINLKMINRLLRVIIYIGYSFVILSGIYMMISYISNERDLLTLGSRIDIWKAAIKFVFNHPLGVIEISEEYYLYIKGYGSFGFMNAHNLFLTEAMKHGIISSLIFIVFYINILNRYLKANKKLIGYVIAIIISSMVDNIYTNEMLPIFLFSIPLISFYPYK